MISRSVLWKSILIKIIVKYGLIVDENTLQFVPAIFSYTGQIYAVYKCLIKEQIRQKLKYSEEQTKQSKVKTVINWWSKCLSMVVANTASRNVAFNFEAA